jgi:hypothetical protein
MTSRRWFVLTSFLLAMLAGLYTAFAPLGTTCTAQPGGQGRCFTTSIFEEDGARILVVVSIPILLALVPLLVRHRIAAIASAVLLWVSCAFAIASVGLFFVPAAVLMTIAATRRDPTRASTHRRVTTAA